MQAILREYEIVTDLNKCKCPIAPIVRYINFKVVDGAKAVFLDDFKDKLSSDCQIEKLNDCLSRHGFKGTVKQVDNFILYGE